MNALIHALAGISLTLAPAPSMASDDQQQRETVSYSDLDLRNAHGVAALDNRVKRAIKRVCAGGGIALWERARQQQCVKRAWIDAERQVDAAVRRARESARPSIQPAG